MVFNKGISRAIDINIKKIKESISDCDIKFCRHMHSVYINKYVKFTAATYSTSKIIGTTVKIELWLTNKEYT